MILLLIPNTSCRKERTCICDVDTEYTELITPRDGSAPSTSVTTMQRTVRYTHTRTKKKEIENYFNCSDRTETSSETFTRTLSVPTVSNTGTFTFNTTVSKPADIYATDLSVYKCKVD